MIYMVLGDGIRRNLATISQQEKNLLRDAFITLNNRFFDGDRNDTIPGHVSFWFKQDEIHQSTHVHGGPAFLPWHREIINRLEALLREVHPELSLHYWDWTTDPAPLFTPNFMGNAHGEAGDPWLNAGFYIPDADPFRDDLTHILDSDPHGQNQNPADPPRTLERDISPGLPSFSFSDNDIINSDTYADLPNKPFSGMRTKLESSHNIAHGYIGGTIGDPHTSFRDPFVFLLHSNVDRLFAMWQLQPGQEWRLDPNQIYGSESDTQASGTPPEVNVGILSPLEPWAGSDAPNVDSTLLHPIRPWAAPENEQTKPENQKNSRDASVVAPPCYDTNPPQRKSLAKALKNRKIDLPTNIRPVAANFGLVPPFTIWQLICKLGDGDV